MGNLSFGFVSLLLGSTALLSAGQAGAQPLTAVVLQGQAVQPGLRQGAGPAVLTPGVRVQASRASWTELAFSDGSSIVLEPGADFTLQSIRRERDRTVVRGFASRGRLRVSLSDGVEVVLGTPGAEVQVVASSAVVVAGPGGSATLLSGRQVVVRRGDNTDTLRRPGFAITFDDGGPKRQTTAQMAEAVESFAPVVARTRVRGAEPVLAATEDVSDELSTTPQRLTGQDRNAGRALGTQFASNDTPPGTTPQVTEPPVTPPPVTPPPGTPPPGTPPPVTPPPVTPPPVTPPPDTPPPDTTQRRSFNPTSLFASDLVTKIAPVGSGLSGSGADQSSSSTDNSGGINGLTSSTQGEGVAPVLLSSLGYDNFGAVRIRRLPNGSISQGGDDTGRVSSASTQQQIVDGAYRNILTYPLPQLISQPGRIEINSKLVPNNTYSPNPDAPLVYDATGRAGYISINSQGGNRIAGFAITDSSAPTSSHFSTPGTPDFRWNGVFPAVTYVKLADGTATATDAFAPRTQRPIALGTPGSGEPGLLLYYGPAVGRSAPDAPVSAGQPNLASAAPSRPGTTVYVFDKLTAGVQLRGIQANERFFAIGGTAIGDSQIPYTMPGTIGGRLDAGTVTRYGISDGLNPTQTSNAYAGFDSSSNALDLPEQFKTLNASTKPSPFNTANAFRPDITFPDSADGATRAQRGDTHLYVVAGNGTVSRPNVVMRADLQVLSQGTSTGAVTVGGVTTGPGDSKPLVIGGQTIGSTRLYTNNESNAIRSNFGSLATAADGKGAHLLGGPELNGGQASYFAVSQADPRLVPSSGSPTSGAAPAEIQPGSITGTFSNKNTPFAYTRLATNIGSTLQPSGNANLQGYASAIVERTGTTGQGIYAQGTAGLGGVTITRAANANTFEARIVLRPTSAGQGAFETDAALAPVPAAPVTLRMGDRGTPGATPRSAYVSDSTFAALGDNHALASVDRDLLAGLPDGARAVMPPSNEHVAWGYFLGDLATPTTAQRDHVNLGFWVAGRAVDATTLSMLTGNATYTGGMIGTAVQTDRIATATGQFQQSWNFGARSGTMDATFDNRSWSGVGLAMPNGSNVFNGNGVGTGGTLAVQGSFFNNGSLFGTATPAAVGGHFAIGAPGYGANGIMVGTRR